MPETLIALPPADHILGGVSSDRGAVCGSGLRWIICERRDQGEDKREGQPWAGQGTGSKGTLRILTQLKSSTSY